MAEEAQEVEQEQNPLHDLVQHALDQDYNNANKVFGDLMTVKLNDIMDQEQVKLASQIYNGETEEEPDPDLDDESEEDEENLDDESEEELDDDYEDESEDESEEEESS